MTISVDRLFGNKVYVNSTLNILTDLSITFKQYRYIHMYILGGRKESQETPG